jgi:hypothetical protein
MSGVALQVLRRLALYTFLLAVGLLLVFRVLPAFGVLGRSVDEELESAGRTLEAARAFGATPELPALRAGTAELEQARQLAAQGKQEEARRTAIRARASGIEAQREALGRREAARRRAQLTLRDCDKAVSELEDLYTEVSALVEKPEAARLLSLMKNARQTVAAVWLTYDQGEYAKVIDEERGTLAVLESVRGQLKRARR